VLSESGKMQSELRTLHGRGHYLSTLILCVARGTVDKGIQLIERKVHHGRIPLDPELLEIVHYFRL
jgi:hypothetical protein